MLNSIRSRATTRKIPTPKATARIRIRLGTDGTCSARTWRSGSDIVMMKPRMKLMGTATHSFLDCVMHVPTRSPIGVIAISTPIVNSTIPAVSNAAPMRNAMRIPGETGAMDKHKINTIAMTGNTAFPVSFNFSWRFVRKNFKYTLPFYCVIGADANMI